MDCFPTTEEMTQVQPTPQLIQYFDASGFSLAHSTVFFKCCECKQEDIIENEKREAEQKLKEAQLAEFRKRESEKERLNRERKSITLVDVKSTTPRQVVLIVPLFKDAAGKLGISLVAHNLTKQIFVQDVRSHSGQLQPFDEIVGVNGVKTTTLKEIIHQISTSPRRVQIHAVRTVGATPSWFKPLGETIDETSAAMNTGQIAARQPPVARTSNMRIENDPPLPAECILITVDRTVLESLDLFVMSTPAVELIVVSVPPSCDVIQAGDIIDRVNGYNVKGPERMKAVLNLPIFSQKKSFKVVIKRRTKVGVVKSAPKASLPVTAVAKVSDVTQSVHPPRIENVIVSIDFSVAHLIKVSCENRLIVAEVPQNCAAVKVGDIIKRVNGHPVDVASDISSVLMHPRNSSASVSLELMRVSRLQNVINLFITVFRPYNMNLQTSEYEKAVKILVPPLNSSHAILIGDRIKSVNGVKINSVQELMQISSENKFAGLHAISLEIERQVGEGDSRSLPVMPLYRPESAVDTIILPINASQDTRQMTISNDNSINAPFSGQNNAPMPNALCTKDSTLFPSNLTDDEIFATARLLDKSVTAYYSAYSKPN